MDFVMTSPHLFEKDRYTPLGAAALELCTCRGWDFHDAVDRLTASLEEDCSCPECGLFSAGQVRRFYADRGEQVNVVPLPRR